MIRNEIVTLLDDSFFCLFQTTVLSSFFLAFSTLQTRCRFMATKQTKRPSSSSSSSHRYYIVFFVHCPTTDVEKERARENREREIEREWRIFCVVCYPRNMLIRWLPATLLREQVCVCAKVREKKVRERKRELMSLYKAMCLFVVNCSPLSIVFFNIISFLFSSFVVEATNNKYA